LHPCETVCIYGNVAYDNTLEVFSAWSDPCRFGKKW
jgi:hypothetical protein